MTEDADQPGLYTEQPRNKRKKRALARAVEAEQSCKARRHHPKADVVQRPTSTIGVTEICNRQSLFRRAGGLRAGCRIANPVAVCEYRHCFAIAIPQGSSPTLMVLITLSVATSITETSFDTPFVTNR